MNKHLYLYKVTRLKNNFCSIIIDSLYQIGQKGGGQMQRYSYLVLNLFLTFRTSFGRTKNIRFEIPSDCLDNFWTVQILFFLDSQG